MKPIIGIVPLVDKKRNSLWMLPAYFEKIQQSGGVPMMLPLTSEISVLNQAMHICDGFLLTGGQDISPHLYDEEILPECGECCEIRDQMEMHLLRTALEEDKPILGICRGIQILNVFCGGTLWQDIPSQHSTAVDHHMTAPYDRYVHEVSILSDASLYSILHCEKLKVNSYHHQAVRMLGNGLQITAVSEDGFIEGIAISEKRFVQAVQWHPELLSDKASEQLFSALIQSFYTGSL